MSALAKPPSRMLVSEFLRWNPGDKRRYELVDGVPRAMAPPNAIHAYLQAELGGLIRNHLRATGRNGDVFANPGVVPSTMAARDMRSPDLGVSGSPFDRTRAALTDPILLVEILSPGNQAGTRANARAYTTIASVQEIFVLRTDVAGGDLLRRLADGAWPDRPTRVEDELVLDSTGFRVAMADLYARTPLARS